MAIARLTRRRRLLTVTAVTAVTIATILVWHAYSRPPMPNYHGDGIYRDLRSRGLGPAYSVIMPEFDLGQSYQAEYRVAGLTKVGSDCGLCFAILASKQWPEIPDFSVLHDTVSLELTDQQGRQPVKVHGQIRSFGWSENDQIVEFFKMPDSFFNPDPRQQYRIRLSYSPAGDLVGQKGFVYIRSGGRK